MRCMLWLTLVVCAVTSTPLLAGQDIGTMSGKAKNSGQSALSQMPPITSRLKFRNGPVCMCGGGLSEAQISAAEHARELANAKQKNKQKKSVSND